MAQNVTIAGAQYSDVPAIDLPKTGGGTARFYDPQGNKALTPTLSEQTNVDVKTFATASVAAITKNLLAQLNPDFVAANIKKDVDLFGLVGTLEAGGSGGKAYKIVSGYLSSTSTDTDGSFTLAHNLGCTPILFMMMRPATFSFSNGEIGCVLYGNPDADESLAPTFSNVDRNKKFQTIVRYGYNNIYIASLTGTVDNNSISFSQYQNGSFTANVVGKYLWFAVGVEGA